LPEPAPPGPEDLRAFLTRVVPFWDTVGLQLVAAADGQSEFQVGFGPQHLQNGVMHGGVLATLIDSACAVAALTRLWPGSYATSVNLQVAYLRPVTGGRLVARGECLKPGRTIVFAEAKVWNEAGDLVCTGSSQLARVPLPRA
jgi:uncharacterized protein (TIGR00369 family)